jgi:hypothetical protein
MVDEGGIKDALSMAEFKGRVLENLRGIDAQLKRIEKLSLEAIERAEQNKIDINKLRAWGFVIVVVLSVVFGFIGNYIQKFFE